MVIAQPYELIHWQVVLHIRGIDLKAGLLSRTLCKRSNIPGLISGLGSNKWYRSDRVDLPFPLWLWQWVQRKVCKLLGKDSEYLWSEDRQNRAYPDVQDTSKTDLKNTLQVLITAGAVAVLGREDVQSLFVDFFNVSAHLTNFLKSTSNGHASRFSLQRWATS